ncbi:MAG: DNA translocase FtsK [Synergistaceae bacterium]|nr:DNA translocase FtsK [Synergistaceae bacterium]
MRLLFSANQAAGTRRRQPAEKKARDREDAAASQRAERAVFIPPMPSYPAEKPAEEEEARLVRRSSTGDSLPFDLAPVVETEEPKSAPTESPVEPPKPPLDPEPEPELLQEREPVPEPLPVLSPEPAPRPEPEREPEPAPVPDIPVRAAEAPQKSAVEILDDLLASLKAGAFSPPEELLAPLEDELPHSVSSPSRAEPRTRRTATETVPDRERKEAGMTEPQEEFAENEEEDAGALPRGETAFPPPLDLFGPPVEDRGDKEALEAAKGQGEVIIETLKDFGVNASVAHIVVGPSVVQFQLDLAPGTKVNKVSSLANELTMALAVVSVRVEAPIPGAHYVGIEIPNSHRRGIPLRMALESEEMEDCKALLPLPMGMKVDSHFLVRGLEDMPHLLVAGTTGSGKSVFVNACILGMCSRRTPDELKLILVDPKHVEFAIYEGLPHLLALPISDPRKAIDALAWAVQEMEARMESFARAHVRNLASYNARVLPKNRRPSIVVVVDELADLMYTAGKEVEGLIVRLAQKARAAGIHLILATQRPSVDVITGLIKANVPARVAFAVPSQTDSRTILDASGADKLLGKGDMLFLGTGAPGPVRLQSPFVTEEQTLDFVEYLKSSFGEPEYIEFAETAAGSGGEGGRPGNGIVNDPKMEEAIRAVMEMGIASASGLQRLLSIGYPKAGRLITAMEQLGILGPQTPNSSKPRDILMDEEEAYEALERARSGEGFDGD